MVKTKIKDTEISTQLIEMIQTYTHDIETYTQEGVQVEVEGIVCYDNEVVHTHTEIERARAQYRT